MFYLCIYFCAFRSDNGVVNVYDMPSCLQSKYPHPLKAIPNLTTSCTSLKFNSTDEVLAVASNMQEKAVKLVLTYNFKSYLIYDWLCYPPLASRWGGDIVAAHSVHCARMHVCVWNFAVLWRVSMLFSFFKHSCFVYLTKCLFFISLTFVKKLMTT